MAGLSHNPPYLTIGTEVSGKYHGAFCEAKVKKVDRLVKCRVLFAAGGGSHVVTDDNIRGHIRIGCRVEAKHPDSGLFAEATVQRVQDCSRYTVVFDDGDETTLRRGLICLKGEKHFHKSETLDELPLTDPERFGNPVINKSARKRRRLGDSISDESSEDESPPVKKLVLQPRYLKELGRVVVVNVEDKRRNHTWFPALVVTPAINAEGVKMDMKSQLMVRSFKDGKYHTVARKDAKDFTKDFAKKEDGNAVMKSAVEKALLYLEKKELPPNWDRNELLCRTGDKSSSESSDAESSDDEQSEEKDRFVAQLYKFMDDRGTPINKAPTLAGRDLNLYKLFRLVYGQFGGCNKVTNRCKWRKVYKRLGLPGNTATAFNSLKSAYKRYLFSFEDFYRKLGNMMGPAGRPSRGRQASNRHLVLSRDIVSSPGSPNTSAKPKRTKTETTSKDVKDKLAKVSPGKNVTDIEVNVESATSQNEVEEKEKVTSKGSTAKVKLHEQKELKEAAKQQKLSEEIIPRKRISKKPSLLIEEDDITVSKVKEKKPPDLKKEPKKAKKLDSKDSKETKKTVVKAERQVHRRRTISGMDNDSDDDESQEGSYGTDMEFTLGEKVSVRYGKGKDGNAYQAKIVEISKQPGLVTRYLVHYQGWNLRYDEWIKPNQIVKSLDHPNRLRNKKPVQPAIRTPSNPPLSKAPTAKSQSCPPKPAPRRGRPPSVNSQRKSASPAPPKEKNNPLTQNASAKLKPGLMVRATRQNSSGDLLPSSAADVKPVKRTRHMSGISTVTDTSGDNDADAENDSDDEEQAPKETRKGKIFLSSSHTLPKRQSSRSSITSSASKTEDVLEKEVKTQKKVLGKRECKVLSNIAEGYPQKNLEILGKPTKKSMVLVGSDNKRLIVPSKDAKKFVTTTVKKNAREPSNKKTVNTSTKTMPSIFAMSQHDPGTPLNNGGDDDDDTDVDTENNLLDCKNDHEILAAKNENQEVLAEKNEKPLTISESTTEAPSEIEQEKSSETDSIDLAINTVPKKTERERTPILQALAGFSNVEQGKHVDEELIKNENTTLSTKPPESEKLETRSNEDAVNEVKTDVKDPSLTTDVESESKANLNTCAVGNDQPASKNVKEDDESKYSDIKVEIDPSNLSLETSNLLTKEHNKPHSVKDEVQMHQKKSPSASVSDEKVVQNSESNAVVVDSDITSLTEKKHKTLLNVDNIIESVIASTKSLPAEKEKPATKVELPTDAFADKVKQEESDIDKSEYTVADEIERIVEASMKASNAQKVGPADIDCTEDVKTKEEPTSQEKQWACKAKQQNIFRRNEFKPTLYSQKKAGSESPFREPQAKSGDSPSPYDFPDSTSDTSEVSEVSECLDKPKPKKGRPRKITKKKQNKSDTEKGLKSKIDKVGVGDVIEDKPFVKDTTSDTKEELVYKAESPTTGLFPKVFQKPVNNTKLAQEKNVESSGSEVSVNTHSEVGSSSSSSPSGSDRKEETIQTRAGRPHLIANRDKSLLENTPPTTPEQSPPHRPSQMGTCEHSVSSVSVASSGSSTPDHIKEDTSQLDVSSNSDSLSSHDVNNQAPLIMKRHKSASESEATTTRKRRRRHVAASKTAKHRAKTAGSDSEDTEDNHSSSSQVESASQESRTSSKTPLVPPPDRAPKWNFCKVDDSLEGENRINYLQEQLQELRRVYLSLKAEVACIDRRRKRLRKKEKEAADAGASAASTSSSTTKQSCVTILECS